MLLTVKKKPGGNAHDGLLVGPGFQYHCALGRSGITSRKREGDGATPAGRFKLLYGYYRKDRLAKPSTQLPVKSIRPTDGWCDDPVHRNYNAPVTLPFAHSHEKMMRDDGLYDICIVLDYNIEPQTRGMGSAIFFHLTRPDRGPTEGCVAISRDDMRRLIPTLAPSTIMNIQL